MDTPIAAGSLPTRRVSLLAWRLAADGCTLSVLGLGLLAVAARGRPTLVLGLIILAGLLDGVDGALARHSGGPSRHGAALDVLADTAAFGLAPMALIAAGNGAGGWPFWGGAVLYLAATVGRLVRTARRQRQDKPDGFIGLPMPATGTLLAALGLVLPPAAIPAALIGLSALAICRRGYPTLAWLWRHERRAIVPLVIGLAVLALFHYPLALVVALAAYAAYPWLPRGTTRPASL